MAYNENEKMTYDDLCMYCFENMGGASVCPHCGKDANAAVAQIQILPGTRIYHNRFLVGRALGQDSGGIVYNALDTKKGNTIRIREYLPRNCAERLNDGSVVPIAGMEDAFETGMHKLKVSVESPEDPKKRHFYFEENGTAYIAQRRSSAGNSTPMESDDEDDEQPKRHVGLFLGIGAAVVAIVVAGVILIMNNMNSNDQTVIAMASPSTEPQATWLPAETPTPTPYVTPTFAALVDPELSWMDFTTVSPTTAAATTAPSVDTSSSYTTVKSGSGKESVKSLQNRLVELGWLKSSQVTGSYDSATTQAVKDFQNYVNEHCSPAVKLTVDGIAGSKTQQWLYNSSVALIKPTATPTPIVTAAPDTDVVNASSSSKAIKSVQNKLIKLGLLSEGSADGKYGNSTKAAVRNFQTRVNEILGYDVLDVSGSVDELTMAYLDYYVQWWEDARSATATPRASKATPTPTVSPTSTSNASGTTIDKSSSKKDIRSLQQKLVSVGLLKNSDVDGVYGNKTVSAVKNFQEWVNTNRGTQTVTVSGTADSLTQQYLDYCIENNIQAVALNTAVPTSTAAPTEGPTDAPTEEPTEEPTAAPTEVPTAEPTQEVYEPEAGEGETDGSDSGINASSAPESISYMQGMLSTIRLLSSDAATGVYDSATENAVSTFQEFVNGIQNDQVLEVSGICDPDTLKYLEYAYERNWDVGGSLGISEDTAKATDEENGANTGDNGSGEGTATAVDENSDAGSIANVQSMLCTVGLMSDTNGVYDTETENAVLSAQRFINSVMGEGTVPENGICDAETYAHLSEAAEAGWNMGDVGDTPGDMEQENADFSDDTAVTEEPTAEPTEAPVAEIKNFSAQIDGEQAGNNVELDPGKYSVSWSAEGVGSYSLYLYSQDGTLINKQENTKATGFTLDTASMVAGETYEVRIGAVPLNGSTGDMQYISLYITLKVSETEAPETVESEFTDGDYTGADWNDTATDEQEDEEEYVEDSETQAAPGSETESNIGAPVINIGSSVYQQGGVTYISDDTAIFTWMADGDVDSYDVALVYEDGTRYTLGNTTDTSKTVNTKQLAPGMYTLIVNANPVGGGESTTAQMNFCIPETASDDASGEVDSGEAEQEDTSNVNTEILNVQMALYRYGLLNPDNITQGVLDYETLEAVSEFQQRVNDAYGYNLPVLDPGSATSVDLETLNVLLNEKPSLD